MVKLSDSKSDVCRFESGRGHQNGPVAQMESERKITNLEVEGSSPSGITRICTLCRIAKPITQFGMRSTARNIRHVRCLECGRATNKREYANKKAAHIRRANKGRRKKLDWMIKQKSKPCMDCGIQYPHYVMDFDHREGVDKKFNLHGGRAIANSYPTLVAEMKKCDLVCSNCHRQRTYQRIMDRLAQREERGSSKSEVDGSSPSAITNRPRSSAG